MPEIMGTLTVNQILNESRLVNDMYEAGMRSVRINTAHLSGVEQLGMLAGKLKAQLPDLKILIDTKGPEVRTTSLDSDVTLTPGDSVCIAGTAIDSVSSKDNIYVNYRDIHKEVRTGDVVLVDDGQIRLIVDETDGETIRVHVSEGGVLGSRKGVSVLGKDLDLPAVSSRDREYIRYAATHGLIDLIAHSFVRSAADVSAVREAMGGYHKPLIAKIENQQGIDNLNEIVRGADGVLIARGDLTACIGKDAVPAAQSQISVAVKCAGIPLYLATNILPSLMSSDKVSEQDVAGIATAKIQGVDVMLLTNETASGNNPLLSVKELHRLLSH